MILSSLKTSSVKFQEPTLGQNLIKYGLMKKHYCFGYDIIDKTRKTPTPYIKYYYTVR